VKAPPKVTSPAFNPSKKISAVREKEAAPSTMTQTDGRAIDEARRV
jgi:hypothetical protein